MEVQDRAFLEVQDAWYRYPNGRTALQGINLELYRGELVVLLGANGSGKTTLLMLLQGLLAPSRGRVCLEGRPLLKIPEAVRFRRIGLVFQDPRDQLFAPTVYEDVAMGPANLGLPPEAIRERVRQALEAVEIWDLRQAAPHQLSFGEQKRAALAGILALGPEVLLLDEPTAGLDPAAASKIMHLLHGLNQRQGLTILMATHDVDLTPLWADRVIVLEQGQLLAGGSPAAVFQDPALVRAARLRLPRVAHLFEILAREDRVALPRLPLTIGEARQMLTGYRRAGGKLLRRGYTTGACAAAAARAAVLALRGEEPEVVAITLPGGRVARLPVGGLERTPDGATAWVVKDAGDDPDVTHGARIEATARFQAGGITVRGGPGVGTVTRPGLAVPPGGSAINPVPLQMIKENVAAVLPPGQGAEIVISVPDGEKLARQTLNPQLGIVGGISILGTTGIVEPMSEEAFRLALVPQIQIARAAGAETLLLTPGRRGKSLAQKFGVPPEAVVLVSNFLGFMLEECARHGLRQVVLWGHAGKLAKVAAGVFHTHNRTADGRGEVVAALAAARGGRADLVRALLDSPTVEGMAALLAEAGLEGVWGDLAARASRRAMAYTRNALQVGTVLFSCRGEVLGWDENAAALFAGAGWRLPCACPRQERGEVVR